MNHYCGSWYSKHKSLCERELYKINFKGDADHIMSKVPCQEKAIIIADIDSIISQNV